MSDRTRATFDVWRARNVRTVGDRGYLAYMILMVAVVMVAPVARAVWLSATSAQGVALLASSAAPGVTVFVVVVLWAGALLWGRDRGPAVLPPFLSHALAASDLPRSGAFRGPVLRNGALVTSLTTLAAGLVAGSLMSQGLADLLSVVSFTAVGVVVGIIATVAWLAGQAFPRASVSAALGVIALGTATVPIPFVQQLTPWGWVGIAYPGNGSPNTLAALSAVAAALVAAVPMLLNRLDSADLATQAARWESATVHAAGMDFSTAIAVYQRRPYRGRHIRAVRSTKRLATMFLIRDAIGATRTPGRLFAGILALCGAGALITFAFAPATPGWLLGAAAGVLIFAGLGPITDGLRHAVHVASDFPLYGISDGQLLANHLLFPFAVVVIVLVAAAVVCAAISSVGAISPILGSLILSALTLTTRVNNALKGLISPVLLAPIPTPVGDLGAAIRLTWALDAVILAALAGASAALVFQTPGLLIGTTAALVAVAVTRWRRRG